MFFLEGELGTIAWAFTGFNRSSVSVFEALFEKCRGGFAGSGSEKQGRILGCVVRPIR